MQVWLERGGAGRWGRGALHAMAVALLLLPRGACLGQASGDGDGTMTLHVYENLIQVPVLVLSTRPGPMAPIAAERFTVSLDSGPRFRATHVRREGDDAIALAILLDGPSLGEAATQAAAAAVMALGKGGLRASDSITVYTRACTLKGSSHPQSGTTEGVERALAGGLPANRLGPTTGCPNQISLWDSLAYVEYALREQAGRRVVVVVSNRN